MKKLNKKGFTIVELVIVIAVIAILAGVLIPTFSSVIKKANKNANLQQAKNFYTLVEANTVGGGTYAEENKDTYTYQMTAEGLKIIQTTNDKTNVDIIYAVAAILGDDAKIYKGAKLAVSAEIKTDGTDHTATISAFYFQAKGNSNWVKIDLANGTLEDAELPSGAVSNTISAN